MYLINTFCHSLHILSVDFEDVKILIIPIFVPHEGCPNDCAFCNQRTISSKSEAPSVKEVHNIVEEYLESSGGKAEQIAFCGGSFTGIPIEKQNEYLEAAKKYVENGSIKSIRLSTRPDYIDDDTVKRLISYGVKNIELGAQSMDEKVLIASKRGHSASDVCRASETILKNGAVLGLQMMTGLPESSMEKSIKTAKEFIRLGAKETRIYPTIVLKGTLLEKMYNEKKYTPQSVEEAAMECAQLVRLFTENDIRILRIGLSDSVSLYENHVAGPYHPSFGELVSSIVIRQDIENEIGENTSITIRANPRFVSKIIGNKGCNRAYFESKGIRLSVFPDENVDFFVCEKN